MANDSGVPSLEPQYLPEIFAALHARNIASEEALKLERSRATQAKYDDNDRKAKRNAKLRVESEISQGVKDIRRAKRERALLKRLASKWSARDRNKANHLNNLVEMAAAQSEIRDNARGSELPNLEQETEHLEARSRNQSHHSYLGLRRPPQNQPTSKTAKTLWDAALDCPIASEAEIRRRWQASLLAGGTNSSVSLKEKDQKAHNAAATALKTVKSCIQKADAMYHTPLEAHRRQDAVDLAIMRSEAEADAGHDEYGQFS